MVMSSKGTRGKGTMSQLITASLEHSSKQPRRTKITRKACEAISFAYIFFCGTLDCHVAIAAIPPYGWDLKKSKAVSNHGTIDNHANSTSSAKINLSRSNQRSRILKVGINCGKQDTTTGNYGFPRRCLQTDKEMGSDLFTENMASTRAPAASPNPMQETPQPTQRQTPSTFPQATQGPTKQTNRPSPKPTPTPTENSDLPTPTDEESHKPSQTRLTIEPSYSPISMTPTTEAPIVQPSQLPTMLQFNFNPTSHPAADPRHTLVPSTSSPSTNPTSTPVRMTSEPSTSATTISPTMEPPTRPPSSIPTSLFSTSSPAAPHTTAPSVFPPSPHPTHEHMQKSENVGSPIPTDVHIASDPSTAPTLEPNFEPDPSTSAPSTKPNDTESPTQTTSKSSFAIPTIEPLVSRPSAVPTTALPIINPTSYPVPFTSAPSPLPTSLTEAKLVDIRETDCADDTSWYFSNSRGKIKTCSWVKKYPGKRCDETGRDGRLSRMACAQSCRVCSDSSVIIETQNPTPSPSPPPSPQPTRRPTPNPTPFPSPRPSPPPTRHPTLKPSLLPTRQPTSDPTKRPSTASPTKIPTEKTTSDPSASPTKSLHPTALFRPSNSPSESFSPSIRPSQMPTNHTIPAGSVSSPSDITNPNSDTTIAAIGAEARTKDDVSHNGNIMVIAGSIAAASTIIIAFALLLARNRTKNGRDEDDIRLQPPDLGLFGENDDDMSSITASNMHFAENYDDMSSITGSNISGMPSSITESHVSSFPSLMKKYSQTLGDNASISDAEPCEQDFSYGSEDIENPCSAVDEDDTTPEKTTAPPNTSLNGTGSNNDLNSIISGDEIFKHFKLDPGRTPGVTAVRTRSDVSRSGSPIPGGDIPIGSRSRTWGAESFTPSSDRKCER